MKRIALASAAAAVAAAACLASFELLGGAVPPAVPHPAEPAPVAAAPPRADTAPPPADAPSLDGAQLASELAHAAEAREQALRDAILRIGEDASLSLDDRLARYRQALSDARGDAASAAALDHPGMRAEAFLRMPGVQRELAALGPSARDRELAHIRRELGYDEHGVARMRELDARREARWQNGLAYMEERARVVTSFEGAAREDELRALRERYFADQAPTIEAEERDDFFRFERPRIYGRN